MGDTPDIPLAPIAARTLGAVRAVTQINIRKRTSNPSSEPSPPVPLRRGVTHPVVRTSPTLTGWTLTPKGVRAHTELRRIFHWRSPGVAPRDTVIRRSFDPKLNLLLRNGQREAVEENALRRCGRSIRCPGLNVVAETGAANLRIVAEAPCDVNTTGLNPR
jgi:hypothetical protein